jgi:hypothetical protein
MKRILLMIVLIIGLASQLAAQNLSNDYIVVDQSAPNLERLKTQYAGQPKVYFNDSAKPAPYIISMMLHSNNAVDLHLFVETQPGSLNFKSGKITSENAGGFAQFFKDWKSGVSGKVVIHSADIFTTVAGQSLKAKLTELTGLDFITP